MEIEKALEFLVKKATPQCDAFDLMLSTDSSSGISVFQGKLKDTEISNSSGVGIRVFKEGRPGYAFTESLEEAAISQMIADAISHTEFTHKQTFELPEPTLPGTETEHFHPDVEKFSFEQMKDLCLEIEKISLESPEVENIPYLGASKSLIKSYLLNSKGIYYTRLASPLGVSVGVVASSDGVKKLGVFSKLNFDGGAFDPKFIAERAVKKARSLLGPRSITSGVYPIVFSEEISGNIINMYSSAFSAEAVQKGFSRLKGLLDTQIASPCFSILNDPTRKDLCGYATFDSEGVPTQKFEVISKGKLNSYLHNLETASKEGISSNGCGSRSYIGQASCAFHNLIVEPGECSTKDLLSLFPKTLLITKLDGSSGCNSISGELSIGAQGFYCENGEILHPVDGLTLSTNFFDLIKNIVALGNEYNENINAVQVPAIAVSNISVSN